LNNVAGFVAGNSSYGSTSKRSDGGALLLIRSAGWSENDEWTRQAKDLEFCVHQFDFFD